MRNTNFYSMAGILSTLGIDCFVCRKSATTIRRDDHPLQLKKYFILLLILQLSIKSLGYSA